MAAPAQQPEPADAILCDGLTKRFGSVLALDHLDLRVPRGIVHGFLGPNGAGKTTALRLLTGLAHPTDGQASIAGIPTDAGEPNRRGLVGYLDQDPRFPTWMTGGELLDVVGRLYGLAGAELRQRADETLALVGLTDAARRRIGGYSGGMRQRLGLAQAVMNRPPVLLLDEPVSALDPEGRHDVLATIRSLAGDSTVLFSTHILADAERICDRVAILDHGRLLTDAPVGDLLERYAQPVYRVEPEASYLDRLPELAATLRSLAGVSAVVDDHGQLRVLTDDPAQAGPAILEAIAERRIGLVAFERLRPSLEDVFLRLTGRDAERAA
ncbi:MAG TPA: ABC transporter ATP-binding protein [Candidatus Limnocylindria bacterium]|nr:ABC transporter ATP-binding protein [Candidatus Limnocylindria bacterium]